MPVKPATSKAAAAASKGHKHNDELERAEKLKREKEEEELKKKQIDYIPSLGNFITLDVKRNAVDVYQELLRKGVIVRPLGAYDMATYLRVTIGTMEQNEIFLRAFFA